MKPLSRPAAQDLEEIHLHGMGLWSMLDGKRLFLSGGTGFFGRWLLEAFEYLTGVYGIRLDVTVLSRDPAAFFEKAPHFADHRHIHFIKGDVCDFAFPPGQFDLVIHAATEASSKLNSEQPLRMADVIIEGTRHMLDFARQAGASRFLLTSSGAVYGRQPPALMHTPEEFPSGPNPCDPLNAYAEGKRMAELLCGLYHRQFGLQCQIARCFAFVGPYLPLDIHFAVGNFIGNALRGEPIIVQGDGTPYRSYLYGSDLVIWLLTILLQGQSMRVYHVGSEEAVSISELAHLIAGLPRSAVRVEILGAPKPDAAAERYVPSTQRTRSEIAVDVRVNLREALQRTWQFHSAA